MSTVALLINHKIIITLNISSSVISDPSATLYSAYARLTLLQSLIIELGLMPPTADLPSSLKAAKRFLKSKAFLNVGDYLWAREQGPKELQNIMYPSKSALKKDLRNKKSRDRRANRCWVKEHGLDVLLITIF